MTTDAALHLTLSLSPKPRLEASAPRSARTPRSAPRQHRSALVRDHHSAHLIEQQIRGHTAEVGDGSPQLVDQPRYGLAPVEQQPARTRTVTTARHRPQGKRNVPKATSSDATARLLHGWPPANPRTGNHHRPPVCSAASALTRHRIPPRVPLPSTHPGATSDQPPNNRY